MSLFKLTSNCQRSQKEYHWVGLQRELHYDSGKWCFHSGTSECHCWKTYSWWSKQGNLDTTFCSLQGSFNALTGNYDINVLIAALEDTGNRVIWHDRHSGISSINLDEPEDKLMGIVLNIPVKVWWCLLCSDAIQLLEATLKCRNLSMQHNTRPMSYPHGGRNARLSFYYKSRNYKNDCFDIFAKLCWWNVNYKCKMVWSKYLVFLLI